MLLFCTATGLQMIALSGGVVCICEGVAVLSIVTVAANRNETFVIAVRIGVKRCDLEINACNLLNNGCDRKNNPSFTDKNAVCRDKNASVCLKNGFEHEIYRSDCTKNRIEGIIERKYPIKCLYYYFISRKERRGAKDATT